MNTGYLILISMAVVPICYKMSYKDQPLLNSKEDRYNEKGFMCSFTATQEDCGCFSSISGETGRRWSNDATGIPLKVNTRNGAGVSQGMVYTRGSTPFCLRSRSNKIPQRDKRCIVCHAYKSNSNEKQLQSLDTYFGKLQHDANKPSSVSLNKKEEFIDQDGQSKAKSVLGSLDDYFGKVSKDANSKNSVSSASNDETSEAASYSVRVGSGRGGWKKMKNYMRFKNKDGEDGSKHSYNETSDFHLIKDKSLDSAWRMVETSDTYVSGTRLMIGTRESFTWPLVVGCFLVLGLEFAEQMVPLHFH